MATVPTITRSMAAISVAVLLFISCAQGQAKKVDVEQNEIGKEAICPVTGDGFTIHESTPVVEYQGKRYYMCCPGCDTQFMENPEKYIKEEKSEPQTEESIKKTTTEDEKDILYWTCSMHPEVKADEAGNCPICGMDLIPVYKDAGNEGSLYLKDRAIELAGISMVPVTKEHLYKEIHTVGKVAYDPELVIAQEEYLNALAVIEMIGGSENVAVERAEDVLEKSTYKLKLLGMEESEITKLKRTRQVETSLIIPEKETWVYADVYENEISWIKTGQKVIVTSVAYPGEEFHGKVKSINPILNSQTRSVRVRIQLSNPNGKLKPGMFVDTKFHSIYATPISSKTSTKGNEKVLAIPKESVLDTGTRKIVWIYIGNGSFQPREVELGPEAIVDKDNRRTRYYPVLNGLEENALIVTNGNFLVDSESRLTGIAAVGYGGALGVEEKSQVPAHQH